MSAKAIVRGTVAALFAAALLVGTPTAVHSGASEDGHASDGECIDGCDPLFDICCEVVDG